MDDLQRVAVLTHTKQFICTVFMIIKFPVEIEVHFFCCSVYMSLLGDHKHWLLAHTEPGEGGKLI